MHPDHEAIGAELARASDAQLLALVAEPAIATSGHGRVELSGHSVFAKLVPITSLELQPENRGSTANLFGLPPHYHYRIGSSGIGAWRELAAHRLVGDLAGVVQVLHARVLPVAVPLVRDRVDRAVWGNCPEINVRLDAVEAATSSLVLLLEHIPMTLLSWLARELPRAADPGELVARTDRQVRDLLAVVHARGVLHMDAHFENLLTDGERIRLCDFGLALARDFELGSDERQFADEHMEFDRLTAATSLVHAVISHYAPSGGTRRCRNRFAGSCASTRRPRWRWATSSDA